MERDGSRRRSSVCSSGVSRPDVGRGRVCWANGDNSRHQGRVRPPGLLPLGKALPFICMANLHYVVQAGFELLNAGTPACQALELCTGFVAGLLF